MCTIEGGGGPLSVICGSNLEKSAAGISKYSLTKAK